VTGEPVEPKFVIRELDDDCKITNLRLVKEDGALAAYLKRNARKHHDESISKTFVMVDENAPVPRPIVGYITILVSEIQNQMAKVEAIGEGYTFHWPAVKIARLAVDERYRGKGLGRDLVSFAVALIMRQIMPYVGCRFITVDSNRPAVEFYEKRGFTLVDTPENRAHHTPVMFLDLHKLKAGRETLGGTATITADATVIPASPPAAAASGS
jgi:ribosomal protein S18 acetylase RimI-like enzyme